MELCFRPVLPLIFHLVHPILHYKTIIKLLFLVMVGKTGGVKTLMEQHLGVEFIGVHCMAHRNNLVYSKAMKKHNAFQILESKVNGLYSFYSHSNKNAASLRLFLENNNMKRFKLTYIQNVRWISSHLRAIMNIYQHHSALYLHLKEIVKNERKKFNEKAVKKAGKFCNFLEDKNAILLMVFNIDVMAAFAIESKIMQRQDTSIIAQAKSKKYLLSQLEKVETIETYRESNTFAFLNHEAFCFRTKLAAERYIKKRGRGTSCKTIRRFETSPYIVFDGHILSMKELEIPLLSVYKDDYLKDIKEKIEKYYPSKEVEMFEALDQRLWSTETNARDLKKKAKKIAKYLKIDDPDIGDSFARLYEAIIADGGFWCQSRASTPRSFWAEVLMNSKKFNIVSTELVRMILSALVIPISSSEAERAFSILNAIKDSGNAAMESVLVDALIRIKMNGPPVEVMYSDVYL